MHHALHRFNAIPRLSPLSDRPLLGGRLHSLGRTGTDKFLSSDDKHSSQSVHLVDFSSKVALTVCSLCYCHSAAATALKIVMYSMTIYDKYIWQIQREFDYESGQPYNI